MGHSYLYHSLKGGSLGCFALLLSKESAAAFADFFTGDLGAYICPPVASLLSLSLRESIYSLGAFQN